jgi:hypothetical protein
MIHTICTMAVCQAVAQTGAQTGSIPPINTSTGIGIATRVLRDRAVVNGYEKAELKYKGKTSFGWTEYKIIRPAFPSLYSSPDTVAVRNHLDNSYDFRLFIDSPVVEAMGEVNWNQMVPEWDGFISRCWPQLSRSLKRSVDWRTALRDYNANRGVFSLDYHLVQDSIRLVRLNLEIRLADGKITTIYLTDDRHLLKQQKSKSPPDIHTLTSAVQRSLSTHPLYSGSKQSVNKQMPLKIISTSRFFMLGDNGTKTLHSNLLLRGSVSGRSMDFNAIVNEQNSKVVMLQSAESPPALPQVKESSFETHSLIPVSEIYDSYPAWFQGGTIDNSQRKSNRSEMLIFNTSRNATGRPWWERKSSLKSSVLLSYKNGTPSLEILRPMKPLGPDLQNYGNGLVSPSGHLVGLTLLDQQNALGLLDLKKGRFLLPLGFNKASEKIREKFPHRLGEQNKFTLRPMGCAWLLDDYIIASFYGSKDQDLYLLRVNNTEETELEIERITSLPGDDVLPHVGNNGKSLAWFHNRCSAGDLPTYSQEDTCEEDWQFVVAGFDTSLKKVSNPLFLKLDSAPRSAAWDADSKRWLVVTATKLLWVKETDDQLLATETKPLTWNGRIVHPTSVAISPLSGKIAIAAEIEKPLFIEEARITILSLIFSWDGKSEGVTPMFDLKINDLPRYKFPDTGIPWATVHGDISRFGLEKTIDQEPFK